MYELDREILNSTARYLMEKHLKEVMDKDTMSQKQTLNMGVRYWLILSDGSLMETPDEFYAMHRVWFQESDWTLWK